MDSDELMDSIEGDSKRPQRDLIDLVMNRRNQECRILPFRTSSTSTSETTINSTNDSVEPTPSPVKEADPCDDPEFTLNFSRFTGVEISKDTGHKEAATCTFHMLAAEGEIPPFIIGAPIQQRIERIISNC